MEQEWARTNIPEIGKSRMALGTAWVHLRPPDPPSFGVLSFLVKNPRAVSEATTKEGRRARVGRCVQISEEFFSVKEFFQIFPPIKTFGELGIDP